MNEDAELLRQYAENRSEAAFAELVRRHLGLVYHAALRQTGGDTHRAQDVAQEVFTSLARKARSLAQRPALAGWLHTSTRYAALQAVRTERRRQNREQEVYAMTDPLHADIASSDWDRLKPFVDEALYMLNERDREAVLLRFFEGRPFADVGAKLAVSEDAARVRVDRALEKLRTILARHGVTSTAAALSVAMAAQASASVPAGLTTAVTSGALAAAGTSTFLFTLMNLSKLKMVLALGTVAAGATAVAVQQHRDNDALHAEVQRLCADSSDIARLKDENARLKASLSQLESLRKDDSDLIELMGEESGMKTKALEAARNKANLSEETVARLEARLTTLLPYDAWELSTVPVPTTQPPPAYPAALLKSGVAGEVVMAFVIDKSGNVREAKAVKATQAEFAAAATEAVLLWKFTPGQKDGKAVNTRVVVPIKFAPNKSG